MSTNFRFMVLLTVLLLLVSHIYAQEATPETPAPRRLLFVSERDGNREIYALNDDGTDLHNLTHNLYEDTYPVWSPDGTRIAFQSNRSGNWGLYTMSSDGSDLRGWTCCGLEDAHPSWYYADPRDPNIIYQTRELGHDWNIGISSEVALGVLTRDTNDEVFPIVSPDNQYIAFRLRADEQWQLSLFVINDWVTSEVHSLTSLGTDVGVFSWSPDSRFIAFERNGEIYKVDVDGALPPINLTLSEAYDSSPAWSPAGNQIAYVSNWEIFVMDSSDGRSAYNLSQNPAYDIAPAWSPDAQQVAFASFRDANWEIYAMNSDGCNVRRLTNDNGWDGLPQWQPQPDVSAVEVIERSPTAVVTTPNANLRDGPGENYSILANASQHDCLSIIGRNNDGSWLQIQHGDTMLWVSASIVDIVGDRTDIQVIAP